MDLTKGYGVGASMGIDTAADAAHGLVSFGLNQLASSINAERNWKYWKKQTDYEQKLALENWNRQNEYNAPKSQMQRYAEAGLNPNLIYGQQNTGGSIDLQGSSSVNTESAQRLEHLGFMSAYENAKQMRAQTSLIKQQTLTEANNTLMRGLEVVSKQIENKYKEIREKGETDNLKQELENLKALHDKIVEETNKITSDISVNESTVDLNKSRKGLVDAQTNDVAENRKTENEKVKVSKAVNRENARHNKATEKQAENELEETKRSNLKKERAQVVHNAVAIAQEIRAQNAQAFDQKMREIQQHYDYAPEEALKEFSELTHIPFDKVMALDKAFSRTGKGTANDLHEDGENMLNFIGKMLK